jgi:hypothetical protein
MIAIGKEERYGTVKGHTSANLGRGILKALGLTAAR